MTVPSRLNYARLAKDGSWGVIAETPVWFYWPTKTRGLKYDLAKMSPEGSVGDLDLD